METVLPQRTSKGFQLGHPLLLGSPLAGSSSYRIGPAQLGGRFAQVVEDWAIMVTVQRCRAGDRYIRLRLQVPLFPTLDGLTF